MTLWRHQRFSPTRRALLLDLGQEPALAFSDSRSFGEQRQFNWRWLFGTFFTGIAGTALMGGALFAAVEDEASFSAALNTSFYASLPDDPGTAESRKGDRFQLDSEPVRRHVIQVAITTRIGEKEIVRTVPFARVFAPLETQRTSRTADIPGFNPMRIFADAGAPLREETRPMNENDGEVSLVTRNFSEIDKPFAASDTLSGEAVLRLVRQSVSMTAGTGGSGTISGSEEEAGTAEQLDIVPENVTAIPKMGTDEGDPVGKDEKEIFVKRTDTLATVLVQAGASLAEARLIIEALSKNFNSGDLHEGQRLRYVLSDAPTEANPGRKVILRASVISGRSTLATAALDENGNYMAISGSQGLEEGTTIAQIEREENAPLSSTTLYVSLYETGLRYGLPRELIDEMIKVYSFDYDFQRRVGPGDSFEVFYAAGEELNRSPSRGDILYAALNVGGTTKRFFRYKTNDDGIIDFYDENGNSAKKFLMRKPMTGGRFTSSFGFRRHPILGYSRMHTGVDWAAPPGSPIMSAGSGTVVKASRQSGYGNRVEIQHANGYKTTYNHLSGYARGLEVGTKVYQGQIIGYVGTTGLSTAPHLHYEVSVNGSYVDPMRIKVPRGRVLEGRVYDEFQRERERIELMMRKAFETQQVASN